MTKDRYVLIRHIDNNGRRTYHIFYANGTKSRQFKTLQQAKNFQKQLRRQN